MINPAEITNSLVSLLREIPELVAEVGGDPERIFAYHDLYPKRVSLELAKYQMPAPGILVAWQGTGEGICEREDRTLAGFFIGEQNRRDGKGQASFPGSEEAPDHFALNRSGPL